MALDLLTVPLGALRCPSEVLALTWDDVLWDRGRFIVRSAKTEHHGAAHATRIVPLFPELLAVLQEAWDAAEPGTVFVVNKSRNAEVNLRTRFTRIVERAGYKPWPKLFQNLRSTRETELAGKYPLHVVTEWCGNSKPIALKHYLRTTEADFEAATGTKSAANALQRARATECVTAHDAHDSRGNAKSSANTNEKMGDEGLEVGDVKGNPANELRDSADSGAAQSGAVSSELRDPDFARIAERWTTLTDDQRNEILMIVDREPTRKKKSGSRWPR